MQVRIGFVAVLLVGCLGMLRALSRAETLPHPRPLTDFPRALGAWKGKDVWLDPREIAGAGVHDYVNRSFSDGAAQAVELYVGYYPSQRTGDTIHSPKNCLPGGGWVPLHAGELSIPVAGAAAITVNEYVVAKGNDQAVVLYWYQGRGRVVASEYAAKFWMVADAIGRNRTDGALVRIWTPMVTGERQAERRAVAFAQTVVPELGDYIPR
ncbi:MAG TPA: EpsI family protein [Terriglobales bacterium]|nr:EpsI family protein [Terriglobales bacterium]